METPQSKVNWGILDILLVLVFIFLVTNLIVFFFGDAFDSLVAVQQYFISSILQTMAIIIAAVYFMILKGTTIQDIGFRRINISSLLSYGIFGGIVLFLLVVLAGLVMELLLPVEPTLQPFAKIVLEAKTHQELLVLLFIGSVLAPLGEEIYFRGMVYPALKKRWGVWLGMLASGLFFAALHFDLLRLIPLMIGGAGLAYLYEKTNSIYACMLAHGLWNAVMITMLYVSRGFY